MEGGGGAPLADTDMSDAAPPPQPDPHHQQPAVAMGIENIPATLSHGGRFIQYNIFGNIFEVTAKYKPPIMPIGKGAYGIVWYIIPLQPFFSFSLWISNQHQSLFFYVFLMRKIDSFFFVGVGIGKWNFLLLFVVCVNSSALNSETNEHVAIKKIANAFDNKIDAKRTLREIKLLRHMDHENVSEW